MPSGDWAGLRIALGLAALVPAAAACDSLPRSSGNLPDSPLASVRQPVPPSLSPPICAAGVPCAPPSLSPPTSPTAVPSRTSARFATRCSATRLRLDLAGHFSEPTGQHTLALMLTNVSTTGCYLFGYPGVALVDASGAALPFHYVRGGDQVVTSMPPTRMDLGPGDVAYLTANKYRCDTSDLMHATIAQVIPPDDSVTLQVGIADNVSMDYCGSGDPGSVLYISPVEPNATDTVTHH